ncbi:hypothetical protein BU25DRAFT_424816 [Macroventuria anomochaeta]|uniref:Uncharacterized protein n=1 Tax=Macroventuria anomochaeta TaxID=301207 RepID=A0ACB6RP96_9PLEO|nr:uncharacterized protein BU25DRAFT_424816 [Macroventuria anomochaeta]KAF2623563.1 hypothetical protein BU25DRAFT_424816 [Macroventuria anomochaeta]
MNAKGVVIKPAGPGALPSPRVAGAANGEVTSVSPDTKSTSETNLPDSDTGSRKRPRETSLSDSPDASSNTQPQPASEQTQSASNERACKKVRNDRESKAIDLVVRMCLRRTEQCCKWQGLSRPSKLAKEIDQFDLTIILRQIKSADESAYSDNIKQLDAAYIAWADLRSKEGILASNDGTPNADLAQAKQNMTDSIFGFFDRESLLKLHPHLKGYPRLRTVLRNLNLSLVELKELGTKLQHTQARNNTQRQLEAQVSDLLAWLSPPEPYPSPPDSPSYNDVPTRNDQDTVMRVQLNSRLAQAAEEGARHREHNDQADSLRQELDPAPNAHTDNMQQLQHHSANIRDTAAHVYALNDEQPKTLIEQRPTTSNTEETHSQPTESHNATDESVVIPSTSTHGDGCQEQPKWGPSEESALTTARSMPQQKANACTELQHQDRMACSKLQTYGEAYKIIINQLIDAENGGPPPHLCDLQMPDAEACYYRLRTLWDTATEINRTTAGAEELRTNLGKFYKFAFCMREAHCLLRVLNHYGFTFSAVLATGWDLDKMRSLQTAMINFVYEEPLIWSKPDVDAICAALQIVSNRKAQFVGCPSVSFALVVAPKQVAATQSKDIPNRGNPPVVQQPAGNAVQQGQAALPAHAGNLLKQIIGLQPTQAQPSAPVSQHTDTNSNADLVQLDSAPVNALSQIQNLVNAQSLVNAGATANVDISAKVFCAPDGKVVNHTYPRKYCDNRSKKKCKNQRCYRLHLHYPAGSNLLPALPGVPSASGPSHAQSGFENANHFQQVTQGAQNVQPTAQGTKQPPQKEVTCQHDDANGKHCTRQSCKFLHINPRPAKYNANAAIIDAITLRTAQQSFGRAIMAGAASNGNNRSTAAAEQRPDNRPNIPCQYEKKNGGFCQNANCVYKHSDPRSKAYRAVNNGHPAGRQQRGPQGNEGGGQNGHGGGHRAPNDYTFNTQQHSLQHALAQQGQPVPLNIPHWQQNVVPLHNIPQAQSDQPQGQQTPSNAGGSQGLKCYGCGQIGHKKDVCPKKGRAQGGGSGGGNRGECHGCGQQGHYVRNYAQNIGHQGGSNGGTYAQSATRAIRGTYHPPCRTSPAVMHD